MTPPLPQDGLDTQKVGFLLIPGFALMSYASAIEPLRAANLLSGRPLYAWRHVSPTGEAVAASTGARIPCDFGVDRDEEFDLLLVCAGGNPVAFHHGPTLGWIRRRAVFGTVIGGVSGGPVILAKAGVMKGRRMTVHWEHAEALEEAYPDIPLSRALYVIDRNRVTCAGGVAPLDLMHALIAERFGAPFAQRVSDWFLHTDIRPAGGAQRGSLVERYGVHHKEVVRALALMEDHVADPLACSEVARRAGVSLRQLERLFRAHLGSSLKQQYLAIRLDRARDLVRQTPLSITEIAVAAGFANSGHFSKRYHARFATRPSDERRRMRRPE